MRHSEFGLVLLRHKILIYDSEELLFAAIVLPSKMKRVIPPPPPCKIR